MKYNKRAIVTGAAGFAGVNLTECLVHQGYYVFAICRPGSQHNERLIKYSGQNLKVIELDISEINQLPDMVPEANGADLLFHMAWTGGRDNFFEQKKNIDQSIAVLNTASKLNVVRFVGTGSQAEYGVKTDVIREDDFPAPFSSYGAAKLSACYLTKNLASQLGIEWVWGRIFSLIGKYEPSGRMLPDLIKRLKNGEKATLSSCQQYWDYLDAADCGTAFLAIGERGRNGEIYNVANGNYRRLKEFTSEICRIYHIDEANIHYGSDPVPFVSLQPSVRKIMKDTGWKPEVLFKQSVLENY